MTNENRGGVQTHRLTAKCVIERCRIMDFQGKHSIDTDGLEQLSNVACRCRIPRLGVPILTGIRKIRKAGGNVSRTGILERTYKKQQAA